MLQSADILLYRSQYVPVGLDQVAHVEITREVARRFNHLYGRQPELEQKVEKAIKSLGSRNSAMYRSLRKTVPGKGDADALAKAQALVEANVRLTWRIATACSAFWKARESRFCRSPTCCRPRRQGCRASMDAKCCSYGNTIGLREDTDSIVKKLKADADRPGARAPHRSRRS